MTPVRAAVALCCGALVLLPGCGSGSGGTKIPADPANRMISLIEQADAQSHAGTCVGAQAKVREAQTVLQNEVPGSVSKDVRQGLADGMNRMILLIQQECQRPQPTQTQTQTTTTQTTTTPTTTTPTTTTPSTTTPTTTTPSTTTPTTTTPSTTTPTTTTGTSTGNGGTPTSTGPLGNGQ